MEYKSQYGQDKWVIENLFRNMQYGFFVDIGAGNGVMLSNTWAMEKELRWEGICIEPHDELYVELQTNRSCITCNQVVMDYNGEVDFHQLKNTSGFSAYFSSISPPSISDNVSIVKKPCSTLFTILEKMRCPTLIHYLSIDTEDCEYLILKKFFEEEAVNTGFTKRRVIVFSIERHTEEQMKEMNILMTQNNYRKIARIAIDDMYIHNAYDVLAI